MVPPLSLLLSCGWNSDNVRIRTSQEKAEATVTVWSSNDVESEVMSGMIFCLRLTQGHDTSFSQRSNGPREAESGSATRLPRMKPTRMLTRCFLWRLYQSVSFSSFQTSDRYRTRASVWKYGGIREKCTLDVAGLNINGGELTARLHSCTWCQFVHLIYPSWALEGNLEKAPAKHFQGSLCCSVDVLYSLDGCCGRSHRDESYENIWSPRKSLSFALHQLPLYYILLRCNIQVLH